MKYLAIDFETTGINPSENQALSFCGILDYIGNKVPIKNLPRFHCYFILDTWNVHWKAAEINKALIERLVTRDFNSRNYIIPDTFKGLLRKFLDDNMCFGPITIAGKNPSFDHGFAKVLGVDFFEFRMIDPAVLYLESADNKVPGLATCLRRASMDSSGIHDESFDAEAVIKLIRNKEIM